MKVWYDGDDDEDEGLTCEECGDPIGFGTLCQGCQYEAEASLYVPPTWEPNEDEAEDMWPEDDAA